jgi:hypothetical protein
MKASAQRQALSFLVSFSVLVWGQWGIQALYAVQSCLPALEPISPMGTFALYLNSACQQYLVRYMPAAPGTLHASGNWYATCQHLVRYMPAAPAGTLPASSTWYATCQQYLVRYMPAVPGTLPYLSWLDKWSWHSTQLNCRKLIKQLSWTSLSSKMWRSWQGAHRWKNIWTL